MFLMSGHYPHDRQIVMINKYIYREFFVEPHLQDPRRTEKVIEMHNTCLKFIAGYLDSGKLDGNVQSEDMNNLVNECFPLLRFFLLQQRATRDDILDPVMNSIDYDGFRHHLDTLLATDWMAIFRIAELEEARRGRALRYVKF